MNGAKIRMIRELRGFSQEAVAEKLGITQASYSRIESNQTKLTINVLEKIALELGVTSADILSHEPTIVNFAPTKGSQKVDNIENFYYSQKDVFEKIISSKDSEIKNLKDVIASLMKDKDGLMDLLKKNNKNQAK